MHLRKGSNFLITNENEIIYAFDYKHSNYKKKQKKMFCFDDNDLMKHDIIEFEFDNMLIEEEWF